MSQKYTAIKLHRSVLKIACGPNLLHQNYIIYIHKEDGAENDEEWSESEIFRVHYWSNGFSNTSKCSLNLGVCGKLLGWLTSYIFNRTQIVHIHNASSLRYCVICGVPHGKNTRVQLHTRKHTFYILHLHQFWALCYIIN